MTLTKSKHMKKFGFIFAAIACIGIVAGCKKDPVEPEVTPSVSAAPTSVAAPSADAYSATVSVVSNVAWTATAPSWVSLTPAKGDGNASVKVEFTANEATEPRSGEIVITASSASTKVAVSQPAASSTPTPGPDPAGTEISTADQFIAFLANPTNAEWKITADIDLTGKTITPAASFAGTLDGGGKVIKNATLTTNLFTSVSGTVKDITFSNSSFTFGVVGTLAAGGTVSGVSVDATCTVAFPEPIAATNYGVIVDTNEGTVENCTKAAVVNLSYTTLPEKLTCSWGGVVGYNKGLVKDCVNSGDFTLAVSAPVKSTFHAFGGVVGTYEGEAGKVMVSGCSNSAAVSVEYGTAVYVFTGGVVGGTPSAKETPGNYGIIENCTNTGNVSMHYISGGSGAYPNLGGVAGYVEGVLSGCINRGAISAVCDSETATWTCPRIAGVGGAVTAGASGCQNYGTITIKGLFAGGTDGARAAGNGVGKPSCFGGVIAAAGPYTHDGSVKFENCTNEASFTIDFGTITETPNTQVGGVFGYVTGTISGCSNKGDITLNSPAQVNRLGGIAGGSAYGATDCTNSGALKVVNSPVLPATSKWVGYVAGIVADAHTAAADVAFTKCTNSGAITFINESEIATERVSAVAGIVGCSNSAAVFTECSNTGTLTANVKDAAYCVSGDLRGGNYY